jgi:uncharacterized membrane protein
LSGLARLGGKSNSASLRSGVSFLEQVGGPVHKGRLEAFSDGVLAIILTIMVLDLKAPASDDLTALRPLGPVFLAYMLSFIYVGIYWNNHHHLFQAAQHVTGWALWANLHLLFWLSLTPFVTSWAGATGFATGPVVAYGLVLLLAAIAYWALVQALVRSHGQGSVLAQAVGRDTKGVLSLLIYAVALLVAWLSPWTACLLYALVAAIWLVPDPRIEKVLRTAHAK